MTRPHARPTAAMNTKKLPFLLAAASLAAALGAEEEDAFGKYVSGAPDGAQAFYLKSNPKLRGHKRGDKLVWWSRRASVFIVR